MTNSEILNYRLINQQIAKTGFEKPQEIVGWLGAMQAQEFAMAKWAIGLRLQILNDAAVEKAFNEGAILRTHLLRPTWHFVCPADIHWILALTAPRVHAANAYMYRKLELNSSIFKKSNDIFIKTLRGGKHLTRMALKLTLEKNKINAAGLRLGYIIMQSELEGIVCSGPREGKQFTYALLEERVPHSNKINRETALNQLTLRYFTSRGPATIRDFVWWSGLTMKEAKAGIAGLPAYFLREVIKGTEYLFPPVSSKITNPQTTFLMPDYDEYGISYKDRSALLDPKAALKKPLEVTPYSHMLVMNGVISGTWKRILKNNKVHVEIKSFTSWNKTAHESIKQAVKKYQSFVDQYHEEKNPSKKSKSKK